MNLHIINFIITLLKLIFSQVTLSLFPQGGNNIYRDYQIFNKDYQRICKHFDSRSNTAKTLLNQKPTPPSTLTDSDQPQTILILENYIILDETMKLTRTKIHF